MKPIRKGLAFIASQQQADGSFLSQSSPLPEAWQPDTKYHTTFTPALILACLSAVPDASIITKPLAKFVLAQKSPHGSFNYWAKKSPARKSLPYPDDLDDTFCSLIGLYLHGQTLVNEKLLAQMVKLLLATEVKPGGPYRTWLVAASADKAWQDVDLAVNANIAYFVSLVSNRLPKLDGLIKKAVATKKLNSPYYPSALPVLYYLARACPDDTKAKLAALTEQTWRATSQPTPLEAALTLLSLCRLKPQSRLIPSIRQFILNSQTSNGSWAASAFCLDPAKNGQQYFSGCEALTTAFCVEALAAHDNLPTSQLPTARARTDKRAGRLQAKVVAQATARFKLLAPDLRKQAQQIFQKTVAGDDKHEITLLPYLFNQSLVQPSKINDATLVKLGLANLYGWIAYTIYDDFLDDEGQPALLSVANVSLRASLLSFLEALPSNQQFHQRITQTFDIIDGANAWEIAHCRFKVDAAGVILDKLPHYGRRAKLAERSLGHGLTPLAVLLTSGKTLADPKVQAIDQAFRQYLIARQINDDCHDWKDDLKRGHVTYVVSHILQNLPDGTPQSFSKLLPAMDTVFWHHSLTNICNTMQSHLKLGRRQLTKQALLVPDNLVSRLLDGVEVSVQETIAGQAQAIKFLRSYRNKS